MINKKNLWFLTLFSLVLVLSVYYVTMPKELLIADSSKENNDNTKIEQTNIIEALKAEDETKTLDEINKLKTTISDSNSKTEDKNKAFDALKTLNQISSKEALLEEKVKNINDVDSFIKIEDDQIKVVVNSENKSTTLANQIMRTIQENFDTKQYIVVEFK